MILNNNPDVTARGGTHWSVAACDLAFGAFYHFDSHMPMNSHVARTLCDRMSGWISRTPKEGRMWAKGLDYVEVDCPQQENQCDCGIYALQHAFTFAHHANLLGDPSSSPMEISSLDYSVGKESITRPKLFTRFSKFRIP
eukprot:TRINITY_DN2302_c0_g1_i6.p1 TRINITY_DN2302_c0_g1~~TRINITY_DN2302_c0_g1_i6.p1  ORF type:complete len:140 (+),score=34.56 TRINITY_DN2302_c0_g1_i6:419-838(+)